MQIQDHLPLNFTKFKGRFNRGRDVVVPPDHFRAEQNNAFTLNGFETRPGSGTAITTGLSIANDIKRIRRFRISTESSDRILVLHNGSLYDATVGFAGGDILVTVAAARDFDVQVMFDRAYIIFRDVNGDPSGAMYVYDPSATTEFRVAAGLKPSAAASSGVTIPNAGNVDVGQYVIAVANEYESGYISPPCAAANRVVVNVNVASRRLSIAGIPVSGETGVVARHILVSRVVSTVIGNVLDYELYFPPGELGRIADNVTTTLELNYYSSQLVDSADYLEDLDQSLGGFNGIASYQGRLVAWGNGTLYASKRDDPESFSTVDGFINVPVDSGGNVTRCQELNGNLYICKAQRTFVTRDDGQEPADWEVPAVEGALGCGIDGIGTVLNSTGVTNDAFFIASMSGLELFNGKYADRSLSWKIEDDWKSSVNEDTLNTVNIAVDAVAKRIYVHAYIGSNGVIFTADYNEGLNWKDVKWSKWVIGDDDPAVSITSILLVQLSDGSITLYYTIAGSTVISKLLPSTDSTFVDTGSTPILAQFQLPYVGSDDKISGTFHINRIRIKAFGSGTLALSLLNEDYLTTTALTGLTLGAASGVELERLVNYKSSRIALTCSVSTAGHYYQINIIRIFIKKLWDRIASNVR
jgi:hypothetical protein